MTQVVLLTLDGSDKDERAISIAAALVELADAAPHVRAEQCQLLTDRSTCLEEDRPLSHREAG